MKYSLYEWVHKASRWIVRKFTSNTVILRSRVIWSRFKFVLWYHVLFPVSKRKTTMEKKNVIQSGKNVHKFQHELDFCNVALQMIPLLKYASYLSDFWNVYRRFINSISNSAFHTSQLEIFNLLGMTKNSVSLGHCTIFFSAFACVKLMNGTSIKYPKVHFGLFIKLFKTFQQIKMRESVILMNLFLA